MKWLSLSVIILVVFSSVMGIYVVEVSTQYTEVKFRGVVVTDEEYDDFCCYGSYYCNVTIDEILYDPNETLSIGNVVTVCYDESLFLRVGDLTECYGPNCVEGYGCPQRYTGKVVCKTDPYYVIPEFPSFLIIPLFMIATILAVVSLKKRKRVRMLPE